MREDVYFLYVEFDKITGVIRLYDDYIWKIDFVDGDEDIINGVESLDNHYDIDDVMDYLRDEFDYVEEIEYESIDEYL